jgi:hypothetical protein
MTPEPRAAEASASPDAHEHGGTLLPALIGAALSLLFIPLLMYLRDGALDLLAFILAASGGIYWGVAATEARRGIKVIEAAAGLAFVIMAMLGLWWTSLWIAVGYVLHGAWDFAHHPRRIRTGLRRWFPPFCATFDWLVALYIFLLR